MPPEAVDAILKDLNDEQRRAVTAPPELSAPVLAGAGSGKTRVLTHRFAWLVAACGVKPWEILAVTFTNKAAAEMRERIHRLLGRPPGQGLWVGTFHALCRRMLSRFHREAGLPANFQIVDRGDQRALIRQCLNARGLPRRRRDIDNALRWISARKGDGARPRHLEPTGPFEESHLPVYEEYERRCRAGGLVDFDELLLGALELLRDRAEVRDHYRRRFRHLLVDEFQDANDLQYAWLRHLAGDERPLFVVGDDDQSIYSWRGARPQHMLEFRKKHRCAELPPLEENYRSTTPILETANALIARNSGRLPKKLRTRLRDRAPVELHVLADEDAEAACALDAVQAWAAAGGRRDECAVLYRTNRQSLAYETALGRAGMPYRVYGGLRFFERREVRDALAWLRLCASPGDDVAWERASGAPPCGIGPGTLAAVRAAADAASMSLDAAAEGWVRERAGSRPARMVAAFRRKSAALRAAVAERDLVPAVQAALADSGLLAMYRESDKTLDEARAENLEALLDAAGAFAERFAAEAEEGADALAAFLDMTALEAGERGEGDDGDAVQLMSLHSAKGLEFPLVVIGGLVRGLLPIGHEDADYEEERRLLYVGITRARRRLLLTYSGHRRFAGRLSACDPSPFLDELPEAHLRVVAAARPRRGPAALRTPFARTGAAPPADAPAPGTEVAHPKFGAGTVLGYEGQPPQLRVQVQFERAGRKWLVYDYARLEPRPRA